MGKYSNITREKLDAVSRNCNHIRDLTVKKNKLLLQFCISLQSQFLCPEGDLKRATIDKRRVKGKLAFHLCMENKEGKKFFYELKDVPHEYRAYMLKRYTNERFNGMHHRMVEYRKKGWLDNYPKYTEEEIDKHLAEVSKNVNSKVL